MITSFLAAALWACAAPDSVIALDDVTVTGNRRLDFQMKSSQTGVQIGRDFLSTHLSGSLMQTLEGIPGVKAMSIGSGQSKPVIRGLGFNRLAVVEDGIKHEGQQWGDDHGLEIDQFSIDRAEVIKGPSALLHGSDAIGGVLSLHTSHVPTRPVEGEVQLFGRSNNEQLGLSAKMGGRAGHFFFRAHVTAIDYADYRVPTDSIQYYSYWIRLHNQRLRNTAGAERDGSLLVGYAGYNFHTDLRLSDSYSKSGFFANAHGLEVRLSQIDYDRSRRDIDLPSQSVNHLKLLSHTTWRTDRLALELNLAWQHNRRKELSEPVSHGYMPTPADELERLFSKHTYTANASARWTAGHGHELSAGVGGEHQRNRRDGWGFIIPDFDASSFGLYLLDRLTLHEGLILNAGVRYDHAHTHIRAYSDWYATPVGGLPVYRQRSADMSRSFNSLTWSAGVNWAVGRWVLKANMGKSFRVPIPKELGADGVNYHIFRYEQGNPSLDPERSYQLDLGISWANNALTIELDPYVNYFPNYIYLNPTADYMEGLQLYQYTQARVLRYGFEAQATWRVHRHWQLEAQGEYLYARQQSGPKKGFTLPFSTPWSADLGVRCLFGPDDDGFVALNVHFVGRQSEIVPPEKPTDGHTTLNLSAGHRLRLGTATLKVALRADNLLDTRYYDHTSYYRLIDVPEPGRNFAASVACEF